MTQAARAPFVEEQHGQHADEIPRTLHQIWDTQEVPEVWREYQRSWQRHNPDWQFRLWTADDYRQLVRERYPEFVQRFEGFERTIQRVDAAKCLILHAHGGVYADLDSECVRSVEPLLEPGGAVVSRSADGVIDGSFLASPAGHPLWRLAQEEMTQPHWIARLFRHVPGFHATHVLYSTGPRMLLRAVARYADSRSSAPRPLLRVLDARYVSSRSWLRRDRHFDSEEAFAHHHYSHSWLRPAEHRIVALLTTRRLAWTGAAVAGLALFVLAFQKL